MAIEYKFFSRRLEIISKKDPLNHMVLTVMHMQSTWADQAMSTEHIGAIKLFSSFRKRFYC